MPAEDSALRSQLIQLLKGGHAHADIGTALKDFPVERAGERPHGLPYSAWQLLEHIRFTLHDLLEFSTNPAYQAPKWPEDYWPKDPVPPAPDSWSRAAAALQRDLKAFEDLIENQASNLHDTIPWADNNQTLLHEALLAVDHTSYHTGELIVLRRLLGIWNK